MNIELDFESTSRVWISAQRGDDYRAERLFRAAHFLSLNGALPPELIRLHDHAGILRPCWSDIPTDTRVLRLIHRAWLNEDEYAVWHMLGDDPRGTPFLKDEGEPSVKPISNAIYCRGSALAE